MLRILPTLVLVGLVAGGWYVWTNYDIEGLESVTVTPKAEGPAGGPAVDGVPEAPPVPQGQTTLRVATVNLGPFDQQKMGKPHVVDRLAQVIRRFDLVAIQDVRARDQAIMLEFVEEINADGHHYDFALPPSVGRDEVEQYAAFLFDRATVQIDRNAVYVVQDEAGRLRREPLVASFLARGPNPNETFTFTAINVHCDPSQLATELELLDDVFRAVRDDGRGEDDVILLGDLGVDMLRDAQRQLGPLAQMPNAVLAISDLPSTTRGTRLVDNIVFDRRATAEFTGRCGVVDLIREFELSMRQAVEISDHLPIWAEFSVYEGGQAGHLASTPAENTPR